MKRFILNLMVIVVLISCNNHNAEDNCVEQEIAYVTKVNAPTSGIVNETIEIEVNFNITNSCGKFDGFEESNSGNSKIIKVKTLYEGCVCTEIFRMETVTYNFTAVVAGDYELKFLKGENEYFVVMISIV